MPYPVRHAVAEKAVVAILERLKVDMRAAAHYADLPLWRQYFGGCIAHPENQVVCSALPQHQDWVLGVLSTYFYNGSPETWAIRIAYEYFLQPLPGIDPSLLQFFELDYALDEVKTRIFLHIGPNPVFMGGDTEQKEPVAGLQYVPMRMPVHDWLSACATQTSGFLVDPVEGLVYLSARDYRELQHKLHDAGSRYVLAAKDYSGQAVRRMAEQVSTGMLPFVLDLARPVPPSEEALGKVCKLRP